METPQWEPHRLMLLSEMPAMRSWSKARVKNAANVLANTTLRSLTAQPIATLTCRRRERERGREEGTALHVAVGVFVLKELGEGGVLGVSVQSHHVVVVPAQLGQSHALGALGMRTFRRLTGEASSLGGEGYRRLLQLTTRLCISLITLSAMSLGKAAAKALKRCLDYSEFTPLCTGGSSPGFRELLTEIMSCELPSFYQVIIWKRCNAPPRSPKSLTAPLVLLHMVLKWSRVALTQTVDVQDGHQVVQLVVGGEGHGLPHRALGHLSITKQAEHPIATARETLGVIRAHEDRPEVASLRPHGVQHRGCMTLRRQEVKVVALMELIRSLVAMFLSACTVCWSGLW
ncbi:hypothetical protein EYF80_029450 [Liparis tanakae]|uniref:Uncharacterized protein n=1 Tax=Liparis tanakae TaxID=230148 RepID=A0A4Z2H4S1_9TELE|nr:hypothetical protein EYF80_029450 [Liparis tanakae]